MSVQKIKAKLEQSSKDHNNEKETNQIQKLQRKLKSYNKLTKDKLQSFESSWLTSSAYVSMGLISGMITVFAYVIVLSPGGSNQNAYGKAAQPQNKDIELQSSHSNTPEQLNDVEYDTTGGSRLTENQDNLDTPVYRNNTRAKSLAKKQ